MILNNPTALEQPDKSAAETGFNPEARRASAEPSERPLLDWLAQEIEEADGLDHPRALRAASRLLNDIFADTPPLG